LDSAKHFHRQISVVISDSSLSVLFGFMIREMKNFEVLFTMSRIFLVVERKK
jgi:hypothetical protein